MKIFRFLSLLAALLSIQGAPPELIGPYGGSASVVQVDPHERGVVVAATSNALLFGSKNSGDSWSRLPFPAELRATLHAFVIAPTSLYLVGLANNGHEYSGLLLSPDRGQNWYRPETLAHKDVWSIAVWPRDPSVIAVGTADGVYLTRDIGEHWTRISPELNSALMPVVSLDFDPLDSQVLYAGTPHLPWKTTDGGQTWRPAHIGMQDDSDVFSIHVDPNRPNQVFATACSGVYRSSNRGFTWVKLASARDASYRTYQIAQDPIDPKTLLAGTTRGLEKSTDLGITWRKISSVATRSIAFDPNQSNRVYVAADEAGLFRSDDLGESLRPIDQGFCNRHVASLAALGSTLYASSTSDGSAGFFRGSRGADWQSIGLGPAVVGQQVIKTIPLDPAHLYVLTPRTVLLSQDGGQTWSAIGPRFAATLADLVAPGHDGRELVIAASDGVYFTEDGGFKWQRARMNSEHAMIRSLVALGSHSVAAMTQRSVLVSFDLQNYRTVSSPAADSEIYALIATEHGDLLAATSRGLRRSEDVGTTWQSVRGILGGSTVSAICKHPLNPKLLLASRFGTIYKSDDDGITWGAINIPGQALPSIRSLIIPPGMPDSVLAVTHSQGVFAVDLDQDGWTECPARNCGVVRLQIRQSGTGK